MRLAHTLALLLSLVACGGSPSGSNGTPDGAVDTGRTGTRDTGAGAARDARSGDADFHPGSADAGSTADTGVLHDASFDTRSEQDVSSAKDGSADVASHDGFSVEDGAERLDALPGDGSHRDLDAASDGQHGDAHPEDARGPACEITYPTGASPSSGPIPYPAWSMDPYHGCRICDPTVSLTAWTPAPNGTTCGFAGGTCQGGACSTGAAIGQSCSYGVDCESGYCAHDEVTGVSACAGSAGQPGDACEIGSCANGTYCIPFTNCDPSQGSRCEIFYRNVCL